MLRTCRAAEVRFHNPRNGRRRPYTFDPGTESAPIYVYGARHPGVQTSAGVALISRSASEVARESRPGRHRASDQEDSPHRSDAPYRLSSAVSSDPGGRSYTREAMMLREKNNTTDGGRTVSMLDILEALRELAN